MLQKENKENTKLPSTQLQELKRLVTAQEISIDVAVMAFSICVCIL